jgi:uncharacterized membrane-anchored protein
MLLSLIAFASLAAACVVLARQLAGDPARRAWLFSSIATAILVILFFIAADLAASSSPNASAGLFQRLSIIIGWVWVALLALRLMSQKAPVSR